MNIPDMKEKVIGGCRHTVILGAGASIAVQKANGVKNNNELPSMLNFIQKVGLRPILKKYNIRSNRENFEDLYSRLWIERDKYSDALFDIEEHIRNWFLDLRLTDEPTIYDYLVLGLRKKDCIATFNWDPLLLQAYNRCYSYIDSLPEILFLHGNVIFTIDYVNKKISTIYHNPEFEPGPILFPVKEKDYNSDELIAEYWRLFLEYLKASKIVTVFGYSAPKTDIVAIQAMKSVWGDINERNFEQFEFIDLKSYDELLSNWEDFVHTHHYTCKNNFFDSHIGLFPRRSGEDYFTRNIEAIPTRPIPAPRNCSLNDLIDWHKSLEEVEKRILSK